MEIKRRQPLGVELVKKGIVKENDIEQALDYQRNHPEMKIGDILYELDVTDFNGVVYHVKTNSGIHLSECEFTLSLSKQYAKFIEDFRNGYIFKGVTANA